jgi:hypothetical protein
MRNTLLLSGRKGRIGPVAGAIAIVGGIKRTMWDILFGVETIWEWQLKQERERGDLLVTFSALYRINSVWFWFV